MENVTQTYLKMLNLVLKVELFNKVGTIIDNFINQMIKPFGSVNSLIVNQPKLLLV